jgi:uroporphyrinogen decarboxylase
VPVEMNPRERWGLLLIDELPDRPPVYPLVTSHAAAVYGCGLDEYCTNGKTLAKAQIQAQALYKHEGLSVFTHVGIIAEAMGSRYHIRPFEVPILDTPIITYPEQVDKLSLPNICKDGHLPVYLEAIDYLYSTMGDVLPIFAFVPCSFTTAAGLRGTEDFLMDTIIAPKAAHRLLQFGLDAAIAFCDECVLAGALPVLVDPLASGSVISRQTYLEFAFPYEKNLIDHLHRYDLDITLHICGKTAPMLDLIPETGADLFSFDQMDVRTTVETMGERVRLVGNIAPYSLLESSQINIYQTTNDLINEGIVNPRGFVLSTGCEVPIRCEPRKLEMVIECGRSVTYERKW